MNINQKIYAVKHKIESLDCNLLKERRLHDFLKSFLNQLKEEMLKNEKSKINHS